MIRLWFISAALLFLTLTLLATLAIMLGTTQPQNPALADFGFCSGAPCYMSIDLQSTDLQTANNQVIAAGYRGNMASRYYGSLDDRCDVAIAPDVYGDEVIAALQLIECRDLHIGELITLLGAPDHVLMSDFCDWVFEYSRHTFVHIARQNVLQPGSRVIRIDFVRESASLPISSRWHGFTSIWRYQQYEPEVSFGALCD